MSSVHLSFDLWTSPNSKAILGLVGHWIDNTGVTRNALLALRHMTGAHSGVNQGELVWSIIEYFQI